MVKNGGAILRTDVGPLAIESGGIVGGEEDIKKGGVGKDGGIKSNLGAFDYGEAGITGDDLGDAH